MDDEPFHIAGDIVASSARVIGQALATLPGASIEISSEVEVDGPHYGMTVYPTHPAPEGGDDFLVGGNVWLPADKAAAVIDAITAALERHDIVYQLEVSHGRAREQVFPHPRYRPMLDARVASSTPTPVSPSSPEAGTLDGGRIIVGDRLEAGTSDEVRAGSIAGRPDERVLITLTTKHPESHDSLRKRLALPIEGIAPIEYLGACDGGLSYADALVERVPRGMPATAPLGERVLARLGADVATVIARAHAARLTIDGIRPELIYMDGDRFTGLVPRGPLFIATAPITRGVRTYHVPYLAPEQFLSNTTLPASDVFALCASLYFLGTGAHPFGDPDAVMELLGALSTGQAKPWPGSQALGDVLRRGMAVQATDRPTAAALADLFAALA